MSDEDNNSGPKFTILGADDLPDGAGEAIAEMLGLGSRREPNFKPATREQVAHLLDISHPRPKVGDVVTLREQARDKFKWPTMGDEVIVTQSLAEPIREGEAGTSSLGRRYDIAIAFINDDGEIHEFMHDSRDFKVVGSSLN